eukprot:TRINITY_DN335_c0_g1_i1.p1 TRINITY_DN335_c0_g1~~TRINITY_DN335_c0_g1_i1.p1  ORF type:complete len:285 (-),score=-15.62 TRINITY_DN335_c0_g1_i1:82-936(-)
MVLQPSKWRKGLHHLPEPVLEKILTQLPDKDRLAAALVCKRWNNSLEDTKKKEANQKLREEIRAEILTEMHMTHLIPQKPVAIGAPKFKPVSRKSSTAVDESPRKIDRTVSESFEVIAAKIKRNAGQKSGTVAERDRKPTGAIPFITSSNPDKLLSPPTAPVSAPVVAAPALQRRSSFDSVKKHSGDVSKPPIPTSPKPSFPPAPPNSARGPAPPVPVVTPRTAAALKDPVDSPFAKIVSNIRSGGKTSPRASNKERATLTSSTNIEKVKMKPEPEPLANGKKP